MNPVETSQENNENLYTDLFWPYLRPKTAWKFGPQGPFFIHTWKYPEYVCKPSFIVSYKNYLKPLKFHFFYLFFVIKDQLKTLEAQNSKFYFHNFWAISLCTFMPYIRKFGWNWGRLFDLKKGWWTDTQTDGQSVSSADYVSSRAKNGQAESL